MHCPLLKTEFMVNDKHGGVHCRTAFCSGEYIELCAFKAQFKSTTTEPERRMQNPLSCLCLVRNFYKTITMHLKTLLDFCVNYGELCNLCLPKFHKFIYDKWITKTEQNKPPLVPS